MTLRPGIKQLKSSGGATSGWEHNKHILQDSAVDRALEKAKTDLLYKQFLEKKRKEDQEVYEQNHRKKVTPVITDSTPEEIRRIKAEITEENINNQNNSTNNQDDGYDSLDELERELGLADDADEIHAKRQIHEQRKQELKQQWKQKQQQMASGAGTYTQMNEQDLLKLCSKGVNCVIHFYADTVILGKLVDEHMKRLAVKHTEARFVTLNSRMSPFLVSKWKIRTLPSICVVVEGYLVDKIIGFDEFGGKTEFPTAMMAKRLAKTGVIKDPNTGKFLKKAPKTNVLNTLM